MDSFGARFSESNYIKVDDDTPLTVTGAITWDEADGGLG